MSVVTYSYPTPASMTGGDNGPINVIVVHSVECPLGNDSNGQPYEVSLIGPNYFANPNPPIKSIHYLTGASDICAGVSENILAWHARGASKGSIGIEQTGYAAFSRSQWMSGLGRATVNNTAKLIADICKRRGIPVRLLEGQALRNAYSDHSNLSNGGITTHSRLTLAGVGGNDHTDPGDGYPLDYLLSTVEDILNGQTIVKDWFDMATLDELRAIVAQEVAKVAPQVWGFNLTSLNDNQPYSASAFLVSAEHDVHDLSAASVAQAVWGTQFTSGNDKQQYGAETFIEEIDKNTHPKA